MKRLFKAPVTLCSTTQILLLTRRWKHDAGEGDAPNATTSNASASGSADGTPTSSSNVHVGSSSSGSSKPKRSIPKADDFVDLSAVESKTPMAPRTVPHGPPSSLGEAVVPTTGITVKDAIAKRRAAERSTSIDDSQDDAHSRPSRHYKSEGGPVKYKSKGPAKEAPKIKIKRKDPWGKQQLRDSWSEDAMSRHDKDSVGNRLKAEYRYHPHEPIRQGVKWLWVAFLPFLPFCCTVIYYYLYDGWIWNGDPQHLLNMLRAFDTSPRSKLSYYYDPSLEERWPRKWPRPEEMERLRQTKQERIAAQRHKAEQQRQKERLLAAMLV